MLNRLAQLLDRRFGKRGAISAGITYFSYLDRTHWKFSINEGQKPNVHASYNQLVPGFYFYFCPAEGFKWTDHRLIRIDGKWSFARRPWTHLCDGEGHIEYGPCA